VTFIVLSCLFFSDLHPCSSNTSTDLTAYGLNDASSPKDVPFGDFDGDDLQFQRDSNPPKTPEKGAWLCICQPNPQNYEITISPTANVRSTPNFDREIEPHSLLRAWSRMTKFEFKMADGQYIWNYWKCYISRLLMDRFGRNLDGSIPCCPRYVRHDVIAMVIAVA